MGWLSPRPTPASPLLPGSPEAPSDVLRSPPPPYSSQARRSGWGSFGFGLRRESGQGRRRERQGSSAAMLGVPEVVVQGEAAEVEADDARRSPSGLGLAPLTEVERTSSLSSSIIIHPASAGEHGVVNPTSPLTPSFHFDAPPRHRSNPPRIAAFVGSLVVLGAQAWLGAEAVVSIVRLRNPNDVTPFAEARRSLLWVEVGVATFGIGVALLALSWTSVARQPTILSVLVLVLSYLVVALHLAFSFTLLFLLVASPSLRGEASTRCGWRVDVLWTTHRGGEVCFDQAQAGAAVGGWVTAAGVKVAIIFVVGVIWLGLLHGFAQSLRQPVTEDLELDVPPPQAMNGSPSPSEARTESDKLMTEHDVSQHVSPRTRVLHSLVGSLVAAPSNQQVSRRGYQRTTATSRGELREQPDRSSEFGGLAAPSSLVDDTLQSRSDVVSSTGPEIVIDLSSEVSHAHHSTSAQPRSPSRPPQVRPLSGTSMPRDDSAGSLATDEGSSSFLSGHLSGHTAPSPPLSPGSMTFTFSAQLFPPAEEVVETDDSDEALNSTGPFSGTAYVPPWPPSAFDRQTPIEYARVFTSTAGGMRLVRKLSTVASLATTMGGSSEGHSAAGGKSGSSSGEASAAEEREVVMRGTSTRDASRAA